MIEKEKPQKNERFPRTNELPTQSPLFWVEQKDRYLRQLLIRDIEDVTGRRLIVYFANRFENAQIEPHDVTFMAELMGDLDGCSFDVLIETIGGMTDATESLVRLIENLNSDFRAIIVNAAKSNGTLLCLAAKSILMGPASELGPIEPLVNNLPCSILIEPQIAAQNYPLHKFGEYALQQTRTLATALLTKGMMKSNAGEVASVVQKLSSRDVYFSHGSAIDYNEAQTLGLNVEYLKRKMIRCGKNYGFCIACMILTVENQNSEKFSREGQEARQSRFLLH